MEADMMVTAAHEAGHAAVSTAIGWSVEFVEIHYCRERDRWEGSFKHKMPSGFAPWDEPRLREENAKVAVAGVLAQAKHCACRVRPGVVFSSSNDLSAWLRVFRDKTRSAASPGNLKFVFCDRADPLTEQTIEIDGSYFGGADANGFNQLFTSVGDADGASVVRDVIALLDDSRRWSQVIDLARVLVTTSGSGETDRRELPGTLIHDLLTR